MIVGIHHVAIGVPDFEAGLRFYTEVLGFEIVEETRFSGPNPAVEAAIGLPEPSARMAMLRGAFKLGDPKPLYRYLKGEITQLVAWSEIDQWPARTVLRSRWRRSRRRAR